MSSIKLSVIFLVVGFTGIAGSVYGGIIDNDWFVGFSLAVGVVGLALSLGFIVEAMNKQIKDRKDDEKKQD